MIRSQTRDELREACRAAGLRVRGTADEMWKRLGCPTPPKETAAALDGEIWRPVVGHPGYEVSDHGRVRSLDRLVPGRSGAQQWRAGQMLSPGGSPDDEYPAVHLDGRDRVRVHILVARTFLGPCPDGYEVCHGDGDRTNNRLTNLRYGTTSENGHDRVLHGRSNTANRTRCPRRHLLVTPNLVPSIARVGRRSCLACDRTHSAARKARLRRRPFDFKTESDARYVEIMRGAGVTL